jgi:hypothetical protein
MAAKIAILVEVLNDIDPTFQDMEKVVARA